MWCPKPNTRYQLRGRRFVGREHDIEEMISDMIWDGDAGALYDPVRRDLILLIPEQSIMLYSPS